MKQFRKLFVAVMIGILCLFVIANIALTPSDEHSGSPHRVEISRLVQQIDKGQFPPDLSQCQYVYAVKAYSDTRSFYETNSDYLIRSVDGTLYRFDYRSVVDHTRQRIILNLCLSVLSLGLLGVLWYVRYAILSPFNKITELPYQLSKGTLCAELPESKNRYFGRFLWGINALRETMEQQKQRELALQKDKNTLLLSLSHDLKTPLSAIKLYAGALYKGLYPDPEKQRQIARRIEGKADELEAYVSQIYAASNEDFLTLEVVSEEFYLSRLVGSIEDYYREKLTTIQTAFSLSPYADCLICGDPDRSIEVVQNLMENAIKYGDGERINLIVGEEEGCILLTVESSGCTLPSGELPHIFDSFWRGSNSQKVQGSGLGLYIARQLMHKMNGEIFAQVSNSHMYITVVFPKA